jgi:hypothetical protein
VVIEEALTAKLGAVLSALVGTRVYPDILPQPDEGATPSPALPPSVVYQRAGDETPTTLNGGRSAIRHDTYTVELWSSRRADGWAFRELMKDAFCGSGCAGRWGGPAGVYVCGAVARDAAADADPPLDASDDPDRAERLSLTITYRTDW